MTTIWVDSRKRVAGTDSDFEFDVGETVHLQGSARLGVFKIRVADTFLSTDRGTYLYWRDTALGTLNWAQLPVGAYTGVRLDQQQLRQRHLRGVAQRAGGRPRRQPSDPERPGAAHAVPRQRQLPARRHARQAPEHQPPAGPQLRERGGQSAGLHLRADAALYSEVYLRCSGLANAADTVGPLGHDIIAKIVCKQGVGHIMEADTHENHMVNVRGPVTLRYLRFKLTDYEGNVVDLRGTSLSFCIYLDG